MVGEPQRRGGRNVFQGGFLGLDNIGIFDRSAPCLPADTSSNPTAPAGWRMYCLHMFAIALELAANRPTYEDMASKNWEHFVYIANALNTLGLWSDKDGFYYDVLHLPDGSAMPLKVRSMVGLVPLFAVETLDAELLERLPSFRRRLNRFSRTRLISPQAAPT